MERCGVMRAAIFYSCLFIISSAFVSGTHLQIDACHPSALNISSGRLIENYPGSRPGNSVICERVRISGFSRLYNLNKYAHSLKVKAKIVETSSLVHLSTIEVCLHRNLTMEVGMCPQDAWEKIVQGSWTGCMSPYDFRLLDVRGSLPFLSLEVSIEEELKIHRLVFLVLGAFLMLLAPAWSRSTTFYYTNAMVLGVMLVIIIVLFQGMKLLPTGRKKSLMIFIYGSMVGLGTAVLRFMSGFLQSLLFEIGLKDDLYSPMILLLLVCLILAGAWLGFWGVRKFVLHEDGSVDADIALFVQWSIQSIAAVLLFQSSQDPLLSVIVMLSVRFFPPSFMRLLASGFLQHLVGNLVGLILHFAKRLSFRDRLHGKSSSRKTRPGSSSPMPEMPSYLSSYHKTSGRKRFSNEEWDAFTKESTKSALKELVSSPDFSRWAANNADRITLAPPTTTKTKSARWFRWL